MITSILTLNAGSSSLKFALFPITQGDSVGEPLLRGQISAIGAAAKFSLSRPGQPSIREEIPVENHQQAIDHALSWISRECDDIELVGVGHRVVHGGAQRREPLRVSDTLIAELDQLSLLAPHHQPHNLAAIRALAATAPDLPQVACFDTAFHTTQDEVTRCLPLPKALRDAGLQRYGFHGLSYEYIADAATQINGGKAPTRLLAAHLGNGASLCAMHDGRSIATTMGFSTLDGVMMGSRSGAIDPGVLLHLMREQQMDEAALSNLLYNQSGLLGVSGESADMQQLLDSDSEGARLAVDLFCQSAVRSMGSMIALLEGIDVLVFTGGIGEHAAPIRERIAHQLAWLGIELDGAANAANHAEISTAQSKVRVWVIPANEEKVIAEHSLRSLAAAGDI
jgi:acetate kinase